MWHSTQCQKWFYVISQLNSCSKLIVCLATCISCHEHGLAGPCLLTMCVDCSNFAQRYLLSAEAEGAFGEGQGRGLMQRPTGSRSQRLGRRHHRHPERHVVPRPSFPRPSAIEVSIYDVHVILELFDHCLPSSSAKLVLLIRIS